MNKLYQKNKYLHIIIFSLFFSAAGFANAQTINYGFKGGFSLAEISYKNLYETQSKNGFNLYVFADYNFSPNFSLSLEEGFTQKGFQAKQINYDVGSEYSYKSINAELNYIDISLMSKVKFFTSGKVKPYIIAGPSFGIKVGSGVNDIRDSYLEDLNLFLKEIDKTSFGIKSGAGFEINAFSNTNILFEIKYNFNLIESYKSPDIRLGIFSWLYSEDFRNNVLEIQTGVKF